MAADAFFLVLTERLPRELEVRGIFLPPLLPSVVLGLVAAWLTAQQLSRLGYVRHLEQPLLAFCAITAIYTVLFATVVFPS